MLRRAGLPHPRTILLEHLVDPPDLDFPAVVKPRFGSWVETSRSAATARSYRETLDRLSSRRWFRAAGAIAQELIPPLGHDLRLIVAGGAIVGAGRRTAAPGEWRTNVALGATVTHAMPSPLALDLGLAAAAASGLDLVGVDLLPTGPGGFSVIELNGAVDFRPIDAPHGRDIYADVVAALAGTEPSTVEPEPLAGAGV